MKFNIEKFTKKVIEGEINALEFLTELKTIEESVKKAKEQVLESAIIEFDKYGEKSLTNYGYEIKLTQSGRYNYSNNDDWNNLKKQMQELEKKMQSAYKANATILDEGTGEMIQAAEYKANKQSLSLKLIK